MSEELTPVLNESEAAALLAQLLERQPAYVPGWQPAPAGAGRALLQIYARYLQALGERLELAPGKNKLAFLDMLGISLLPAQAARAPVVFSPISELAHSRVPPGTQVGAKGGENGDETLTFSTENGIALAASYLVEVVTVWPGKDAYADHSSAAMGGEPFTLFEGLQQIPHELYLAHSPYFALSGKSIVELQFELNRPGSAPLDLIWEYWDGEVWRSFIAFREPEKAASDDSVDGSDGLTRSGIVRLVADCAETEMRAVNGLESYWLRGRVAAPLPAASGETLPIVDRVQASITIEQADLEVDLAYADGIELDLSKSFFPFGQQPQPGASFYFTNADAFGKGGAQVTLHSANAETAQEEASNEAITPPTLALEYWDGTRWRPISPATGSSLTTFFGDGGDLVFDVPVDLTAREINNEEALWMRVRVENGSWYRKRTVSFEAPAAPAAGDTLVIAATTTQQMTIVEVVPPALRDFSLDYTYSAPLAAPDAALAFNDFRWQDVGAAARWRGTTFEPFQRVEDRTPTLYLGFNRPLPADLISLYVDVEEAVGQTEGPTLKWEFWEGSSWRAVVADDETENLALPGMVAVPWPGEAPRPQGEALAAEGKSVEMASARQAAPFRAGDLIFIGEVDEGELATVDSVDGALLTLKAPLADSYQRAGVALARLPRFGAPRSWLRARRQTDGAPLESTINGIYLNAVWAAQIATFENEILGSSTGQKNQVFFFRQTPVLADEVVEVRELRGPRAAVEWPILQRELEEQGVSEDALRTVTDPRSGEISEVWVRWERRPHLFFSGPDDRHYVLERSSGRLRFGDDLLGRLPPAGQDNILGRNYRAGGGVAGNVAAGAINQLLSGVLAESVTNPRAAEGGADGEPIEEARRRGPHVIRHRMQALSLADYEALAREASPAVAVARALPVTHPSGRNAPGWVRLIIMPQSEEARPQASFGLRRRVQQFVEARMPAGVAGRISVAGPDYLPVGVEATIAPRNLGAAGAVLEAAEEALRLFLHPLYGGPESEGWPFGRDVHLSDVASVLEAVAGVDYVETLTLLLGGTPRGESVAVPPDRIVVAGDLRITLSGGS